MRLDPWTEGNQIRLLENGEEYFPRVLEVIAAAQREIFLETFILFEDKVGFQFHAALIDAARRGVRVELTVDGYGSAELSAPFIAAMTDVGIGFHIYRAKPKFMGFRTNLFRRLHRKIVVADGRIAFCGGLNIAHEHLAEYGASSKQDYAVEIEGPLVRQIHRYCELAVAKLARDDGREHWWRQRPKVLPVTPPPEPIGRMAAIFAVRDNGRHQGDIERYYRAAIAAAHTRIVIANAYFFPGYRLLRAFRGAALRGVEVVLILQGNPDMPKVKWASETLYGELLRNGVLIYEYAERPLHAKVAVIDGDWSTVGSSNLDPLSLYLNLEANIVIRDAGFNRHLSGRLQYLIDRHCKQVDPDAAPHRALAGRLFSYLAYHVSRRFPGGTGWAPAHALEHRLPAPPREADEAKIGPV